METDETMTERDREEFDTWQTVAGHQIRIRTMHSADIPSAMRLKQLALWNQTRDDWRRFLALEPAGGFVATRAGRVVGTVTTCSFRSVAWIGMMLVDPEHRRQGIGTRLMRTALGHLDDAGCTCVRLDATPMGATVYRPLGFHDDEEIVRVGWRPHGVYRMNPQVRVRDFRWQDWPSLAELDRATTGADRTKLLKRLLVERDTSVRVVGGPRCLTGFALRRPGSRADQIGPLVALNEHVGRALLIDSLRGHPRCPVLLDIPAKHQHALAAIRQVGLTVQRSFMRMSRGVSRVDPSPYLWAGSGPEKG